MTWRLSTAARGSIAGDPERPHGWRGAATGDPFIYRTAQFLPAAIDSTVIYEDRGRWSSNRRGLTMPCGTAIAERLLSRLTNQPERNPFGGGDPTLWGGPSDTVPDLIGPPRKRPDRKRPEPGPVPPPRRTDHPITPNPGNGSPTSPNAPIPFTGGGRRFPGYPITGGNAEPPQPGTPWRNPGPVPPEPPKRKGPLTGGIGWWRWFAVWLMHNSPWGQFGGGSPYPTVSTPGTPGYSPAGTAPTSPA